MRRTLLFLVLALVSMPGLAGAAEPNARCAAGRFQGFYAGVHVGATSWDTSWVDRDAWVDNFAFDWALGTVKTTRQGIAGGLQAGYNWQPGCAVFGIEIDGSWADLNSEKSYRPTGGPGTTLHLRDSVDWYGTLRARGGIVVDSVLIYLTAGLAYADINHHWRINDPFASTTFERFTASSDRWGLAAGVGLEWAFMPRLSVKAEGLYLTFPEVHTSGFSAAGNQKVHFDNQDSLWVGRLGLNFKF